MAGRLTARKVGTAKAGKYGDGGNLYLVVSPIGSRKWVLRFTWRGQAKEMGLGSAVSVPLSDAREGCGSPSDDCGGLKPHSRAKAQRWNRLRHHPHPDHPPARPPRSRAVRAGSRGRHRRDHHRRSRPRRTRSGGRRRRAARRAAPDRRVDRSGAGPAARVARPRHPARHFLRNP